MKYGFNSKIGQSLLKKLPAIAQLKIYSHASRSRAAVHDVLSSPTLCRQDGIANHKFACNFSQVFESAHKMTAHERDRAQYVLSHGKLCDQLMTFNKQLIAAASIKLELHTRLLRQRLNQ